MHRAREICALHNCYTNISCKHLDVSLHVVWRNKSIGIWTSLIPSIICNSTLLHFSCCEIYLQIHLFISLLPMTKLDYKLENVWTMNVAVEIHVPLKDALLKSSRQVLRLSQLNDLNNYAGEAGQVCTVETT